MGPGSVLGASPEQCKSVPEEQATGDGPHQWAQDMTAVNLGEVGGAEGTPRGTEAAGDTVLRNGSRAPARSKVKATRGAGAVYNNTLPGKHRVGGIIRHPWLPRTNTASVAMMKVVLGVEECFVYGGFADTLHKTVPPRFSV